MADRRHRIYAYGMNDYPHISLGFDGGFGYGLRGHGVGPRIGLGLGGAYDSFGFGHFGDAVGLAHGNTWGAHEGAFELGADPGYGDWSNEGDFGGWGHEAPFENWEHGSIGPAPATPPVTSGHGIGYAYVPGYRNHHGHHPVVRWGGQFGSGLFSPGAYSGAHFRAGHLDGAYKSALPLKTVHAAETVKQVASKPEVGKEELNVKNQGEFQTPQAPKVVEKEAPKSQQKHE